MVLVDTAGIRRKGKVTKEASELEGASVFQAIRAMERCNVAVLLCDGAAGVAEQDAKILGLAVDRGRAIVIAVNKTDLLDATERKSAEEKARDKLSFAPWAPVVPISAKTGRGVGTLLETVKNVSEAYRTRVSTGQLNRFFEQVLSTHPPPTMGNRAPRLFFITQAETGAAALRRDHQRAGVHPLQLPALRDEPAPQSVRLRRRAGPHRVQKTKAPRRRRRELATSSSNHEHAANRRRLC